MKRQYAALRGIAIFLVILNHSLTLSKGWAGEHGFGQPSAGVDMVLVSLQSLGVLAVPSFYFISGGFQAFAMQGKTISSGYRVIAKALPHIIIPYLIWSAIFYLLLFFLQGTIYSIPEYLKFLAVGYPLNFVPLLVFYYVLSPPLVRLISRWPWVSLLIIGIYQVFSLMVLRPFLFGFELPAWALWLTIPGLRLSIALWGVFFPLGIAVGVHDGRVTPIIQRSSRFLWSLCLITYLGVVIHGLTLFRVPIAGVVLPLFVVLTFPIISRATIPLAFQFEGLGRRSYGLYLSNLIWINIGLLTIDALAPGLFTMLLLLAPILIGFTIGALWIVMAASEKMSTPLVRRYVFG
jgi:hypothetical protein